MQRRLLILALGLTVVAASWFAFQSVAAWRLRSELRLAARDFAARRISDAKTRLTRLAKRWPGRGEVEYWLGVCEMEQGHPDAAMAAWERVPDDAAEAPRAALSRGRVAIETCRYGLAESCLERIKQGPGELGDEARRLVGWLDWMTGRYDEYRRLLRREADGLVDPSQTLRSLWSLDNDPYPLESMTLALERAGRLAPEDDRVWLARADLATRSGRFDEADSWLQRCERARPDDPVVWTARLEWAKAAGRPDEVTRAAAHLPAASFSMSQVLRMTSWLAAAKGDRKAETKALTELVTLEPGDFSSFERLADLAAQDGDMKRVAELRRRKAALEAAREHYRAIVNMPELASQAAEMARAAEAIGRRFDARTWWRLAAYRDRSLETEAVAAVDRLTENGPASVSRTGTLADLLGLASPGEQGKTTTLAASGNPAFRDDAGRSGLVFTFDNGLSDLRQLPETMSGGIAVLDFDGDGWLDVYAVQGGPFPPRTSPPAFGDRLFHNRGDGRFEDVTAKSGLGKLTGGYGFGIAVGDYDNDGRPDLFVTRWRSYALYRNLGQGRFEECTAIAGLGGDRDWPTSAAWADLDDDGDLDLYVCHYLKWDTTAPTTCVGPDGKALTYCDPRYFHALPDHVFRNDRGHFVDVTDQAGIVDPGGRGLGVLATDLDGDGKTDLLVTNDTTANYVFRNLGGFRFVEKGMEFGLATNASGAYLAGMGIACGDFDSDGRIDIAVTNFYGESTTLYHNHGDGLFSDRTAAAGLSAATRVVLGFGLVALDANNDGKLDLAQSNGHVGDYRPSTPYAMPAQLFLGDGAGKMSDVSAHAGPPWTVPRLGRGMTAGDFDNDGRVDLVMVVENEPVVFFHNQTPSPGHFVTLRLEGTASNRDAVGARVAVTCAGGTQVATRFGGGSYMSALDARLHFGLGQARTVDRVEVTWPSGKRDTYHGLAADTGYQLREGDPTPKPLLGFRALLPAP